MTRTWTYNWRQSPAHIWFLTTFLKPRQLDDRFQGIDWERALGEPPADAFQRFFVQGVVRRAPLPVALEVQYTGDELRALARERGLPTGGTKAELAARLAAAKTAIPTAVYQCSSYGEQLAQAYLANPEQLIRADGAPPPAEDDAAPRPLPKRDVRRLLRWLLTEGLVIGVVGNAAYDLLQKLAAEAGEALPRLFDRLKSYLAPQVVLHWCHVPAGYFWMGSALSDRQAYDFERPQHKLYLPDYVISQFPITNEQYAVFVRDTGQRAPRHWENGRVPRHKADHPVVWVDWEDARAFCRWAARQTGHTIRLPSEAEWEKAARGSDGRLYPWGNRWRDGVCNSEEAGIGDTTPVDRYPGGQSPYEVYDMAGNVWEWTASVWGSYPFPTDGRREKDSAEGPRVIRGGGYWTEKRLVRAAFRDGDYFGSGYFGFRVCGAAPFSPL